MPIKINLSDKLVLTSDKRQFILNQRSIAEEGKTDKDGNVMHRAGDEILSPFAFYSDLASCLNCVPNRVIMQSNAKTIGEVLDEVKNVRDLIRKAMED
jgi:hypothetical protein